MSDGTITVGDRRYTAAEAGTAVRRAGAWFWWIAGLSLVNSIAAMSGGQFVMVVGLGIGQFVDALFVLGTGEIAGTAGTIAKALHLGVALGVAGVFFALGWWARRPSLAGFVVGMALYALDALLMALFADWISVGFHGLVLFFLWGGVVILRAMQAQGAGATTAV